MSRLDLFGSATKGTFDAEASELDFVLTFEERGPPGYAKRYLGFANALEQLFSRPVDLVIEKSITNPYFQEEIDETRRSVVCRA